MVVDKQFWDEFKKCVKDYGDVCFFKMTTTGIWIICEDQHHKVELDFDKEGVLVTEAPNYYVDGHWHKMLRLQWIDPTNQKNVSIVIEANSSLLFCVVHMAR